MVLFSNSACTELEKKITPALELHGCDPSPAGSLHCARCRVGAAHVSSGRHTAGLPSKADAQDDHERRARGVSEMVGLQLVAVLLYAAGGPLQQKAPSSGGSDFEHGLTAWLDSVGAGSCAPVRGTLSCRVAPAIDMTLTWFIGPAADACVAALRAGLYRTRICDTGLRS
eukprot:COSAG02_NODE_21851_length_773_cov_0.669139_1_plen_170_part_00